MESRIIFDVATKPFPWEPIWAALGAFAFGCLMIILKKLKWRNAVSVKVGYLFMLAAVLGASTDCASWYMSRHGGMKSLTSGGYKTMQGVVENFHPMPDDGSSKESFTISGYTFSYSDYYATDRTTCFNQTAFRRGPIHPGMALRIKFVDQCILRIEAVSEIPAEAHE